jgi:hypothetical protein
VIAVMNHKVPYRKGIPRAVDRISVSQKESGVGEYFVVS